MNDLIWSHGNLLPYIMCHYKVICAACQDRVAQTNQTFCRLLQVVLTSALLRWLAARSAHRSKGIPRQ